MPYFSSASSGQHHVADSKPSTEVRDKLDALSLDEPLPEVYRSDRIWLFAQSPRKLFLYWELARDPFEALRRVFGAQQAALYALAVKLVQLDGGEEILHTASLARSHWFEAQPNRSYRAEVGLLASGRAFIRLLSSNIVRTPRAGVASFSDLAPQWKVTLEEFTRVLDEAGYTSDALEVALEAADVATDNRATRMIAAEIGGGAILEVGEEQLTELRGLIAALAFGVRFSDLAATLSAPFAGWLEQLHERESGALDSARLLEILHSIIGLEATRNYLSAPGEKAAQRAARITTGASEVWLPRQPFHIWLPSMTAATARIKGAR